MGMSASQVRLLTLTARLSDLEYRGQSICNSKIRLADQTEDAAVKYSAALDEQKLTVYSSDTASYVDATAANLTTFQGVSSLDKQRFLVNSAGQVMLSEANQTKYNKAIASADTLQASYQDGTLGTKGLSDFLALTIQSLLAKGLTSDSTEYKEQIGYQKNIYNGLETYLKSQGCTTNPNNADKNFSTDESKVQYYTNVFNKIKEDGSFVEDSSNMNDGEWLEQQVNNGTVFIQNWNYDGGVDGEGDFENVPWKSGDASIRTEDDDSGIARAQAEYDLTMAGIESKDKKFDLELKQIDTEHNAVQTEIDSVKKVIDKNIQRSFKIFDA